MLHLSSVVKSTAPNPKTKDRPMIPLAQFNLEITLLKGGMKRFKDNSSWAKFKCEKYITDEAFKPKVYSLSLEIGKFRKPQR